MRARGIAVVALGLVGVAVGLWFLSRGSISGPPSASVESGPRHAEAADPNGPYRLTFDFPHATWSRPEPIAAMARLEYVGPGVSKIWGSGTGAISFSLNEVNGDRDMGGGGTADCREYTLSATEPMVTGLTKVGGFDARDPNAAFWQAFFRDPAYHLPDGDWEITAMASFLVGVCQLPEHHMNATLRIRVTG